MPSLTMTYTGLVNGDTPATFGASPNTAPTIGTTATGASHFGTYPITASAAVDPDYTISYTAGTLTVTAVPLTIAANNKSMTYGGSLPSLTASYTGLVNGDSSASLTTQPTLSTAPANSPAGSYTITASGAVDPDYTISYVTGALAIGKAALTITADNKSMVVHGSVPALTWKPSGLVNGDANVTVFNTPNTAPNCSTTATSASLAGSYTITCSGAANPNYTITYVAGNVFVQYRFDGFLQPINDTGHTQTCGSPCPLSVFKAGSTVPVKFVLKDTSGNVLVPGPSATMPVWMVPQDLGTTTSPIDESIYTDTPTPGDMFTWDGSQYHFNWKTTGFKAGHIYFIGAILDDGEVVTVNIGLK
jgi:hypothetical protein